MKRLDLGGVRGEQRSEPGDNRLEVGGVLIDSEQDGDISRGDSGAGVIQFGFEELGKGVLEQKAGALVVEIVQGQPGLQSGNEGGGMNAGLCLPFGEMVELRTNDDDHEADDSVRQRMAAEPGFGMQMLPELIPHGGGHWSDGGGAQLSLDVLAEDGTALFVATRFGLLCLRGQEGKVFGFEPGTHGFVANFGDLGFDLPL